MTAVPPSPLSANLKSAYTAWQVGLKMFSRMHRPERCSSRSANMLCLVLFSLLLFASVLLAGKVADPGPEADGVYSCGKEVKGKYAELGKLEIKAKTYATYSETDPVSKEKKAFSDFTTDGRGHIKWSMAFQFLDSSTQIDGASEYFISDGGMPSILVNYSENHHPTFMTCTKEK